MFVGAIALTFFRAPAAVRLFFEARLGAGLDPFGAVQRAALLAALHAGGIQGAAHDVIAHAGQVLDAAAPHHDDGVLLQVVALARDVGQNFKSVGQTHLGHLAQSGVGLLGGGGVDPETHALALGARVEGRGLGLLAFGISSGADQLADGWH